MHVSLWNVALQTVNFVVLAWLLQRFLFRPVRAAIERRAAETNSAREAAEREQAAAARTIAEYTARAAAIPEQAAQAKEAVLAAAEAEAVKLREEAARRAALERERGRAELKRERDEALRLVEERAAELATVIAERLLRELSIDVDSTLLARLTSSIDALEPGARAEVARALRDEDVELVAARALEPEARARLESWLTAVTGRPRAVNYRVDASLVAGVELRLPSGVWRSHFRALLDRVRAELETHAAAA